MKHLGDITKLKGSEVPLVDIVTGGSPCQDLSVAGKREGLAGERSGLFMEQIRLIKEMRESDRADGRTDEYIRPRYMVWENVPGAFSSNKGEDFRCVLEETAKVADSNAIIPRLATGKDGKQKWSKSGCIMGDGWSIAWRVHDAQFWGVPQRRKRISLVADFGGETAPEILFECKGLSGDTAESGKEGEDAAADVKSGIEETSRAVSFQERAGKPGGGKGILIQNERTGALSTLNNQSVCAFEPGAASRVGGHVYNDNVAGTVRANAGDNQQAVVYGIGSYDSNAMKSDNPHSGIYEADTSRTLDNNGGSPACNQGGMAVVQVETEVEVRKYPVDIDGLIRCLQNHRMMSVGEIAEKLNKPKTLVEHWFRKDKYFAIPDADAWIELKTLLNIETDEFDKSIMTFEIQPNKFDMSNRIHMGDVSPTFTANGENTLFCLEGNGSRPSHKGDGYVETDTMYTLNSTEHHAVAVENHPADSRVKISEDGKVQTLSSRMGTGGGNVPLLMEEPYNATTGSFIRPGNSGIAETLVVRDYKDPQIVCNSVVRRLTPLECERLQGFPTIRKVRFTEMTKDEYIAWNINEGHIVVDTEYGKVFATRGQGGIKLDEPKELMGSVVNGYRVVSIRNGNTKMQCRVHRIVWIAEHGVIPDGYVIDHINNDKQDNRLCNLQLLTPKENSTKARADGLYKIHGEAGQSKITDEVHDFIQYVYGNTDLSIRQLSEIFGISKSRVHQIIHDEAWTDIGDWVDSKGKKHKGEADSPRYKALGNSIALPFWQYLADKMCAYLKEPTMASLFDGIGGFPLVFSRCGCTPVWASEIEEFPIAVTKIRFKEEVET